MAYKGGKKKDYYEILQIPKNSTVEQIRKAYYKRAKETHPDKHGDKSSDAEFKLVSEAYQILSDSKRKIDYDSPHPTFHFDNSIFKKAEDLYREMFPDEDKLMMKFYESDDPFKIFFEDAEIRGRPGNPYNRH